MVLRIKKIAGTEPSKLKVGFEIEGNVDEELTVNERIVFNPRIQANDGGYYQYFYTTNLLKISDPWPKVGTKLFTENSIWEITFINR